MIDVKDRVPRHPGRFALADAGDGKVDLTRADEPIEQGTPLDRQTARLLQADIRTYPAREDIRAGEVVNVGREQLNKSTWSDLSVGSIVQLQEGTTHAEYIVVHQGIPDADFYDTSCDGTWLLRKDIIALKQLSSSIISNPWYPDLEIQTYLQDCFNALSDGIKNAAKTPKIPYKTCSGDTITIHKSSNGCTQKMFLLDSAEVGITESRIRPLGSLLDYFKVDAQNRRIAQFNGTPEKWATRNFTDDSYATSPIYVTAQGSYGGDARVNYTLGIRPCIILDAAETMGDLIYSDIETVYRDVVAVENVKQGIVEYNTSLVDVCKLNSQQSAVIAGYDGIGNKLGAFLIDNSTGKKLGSATELYPYQVGYGKATRLDNTHFVVTFNTGNTIYAVVGTVTGASTSIGSRYTVSSNSSSLSAISIDKTHIAVFWSYGSNGSGTSLRAAVLTVNGTNITVGTAASLTLGLPRYVNAARLPDAANGDKRVCICFADTGDGNKGKAVIATITAANAVAFGTVRTFDALEDGSNGVHYVACASNGEIVAVTYARGGKQWIRILIANGQSVESILEAKMLSITLTQTGAGIDVIGKKIIVAYAINGGMAARVINITNNVQLDMGTEYQYAQTSLYTSLKILNETNALIAYAAGANSYGTSTILTVNGNRIAGSFIDESRDAIALHDASAGEPVECAFAGSVQLAGVKAGDRIDSDGVCAYSPRDGWLTVQPEREKQRVVGVVAGVSGAATELHFGFIPSLIVLTSEKLSSNNGYSIFAVINPVIGATVYAARIYHGNSANETITLTVLSDGISFAAGDIPTGTWHYIAFK